MDKRSKAEIIADNIMYRVTERVHIPYNQREIIKAEIMASMKSFSMEMFFSREEISHLNTGGHYERVVAQKEEYARMAIMDGLKNCGHISRSKEKLQHGEKIKLELIAIK